MRAKLEVETDGATDLWAVIANVSRSGILVATKVRAAVGQMVYFTFNGLGAECLAVGTITTNREEVGFVVQFQGETMEMKAFFDHLESLAPQQQWELMQSIEFSTLQIV